MFHGHFTRTEQRFDILFDSVGNHSVSACRRIITLTGAYIMAGGPLRHLFMGVLLSRFVKQRLIFFISAANKEDLVIMKELIEANKVTPVIDRQYTLSEVPAALRYLGEGHARGKVIITVV